MKKQDTVLILRSNDCLTDSRVMRIVSIYKNLGLKTLVIGWDRTSIKPEEHSDIIYLKRKTGFGKGLGASSGFIAWFLFLFKIVLNKRQEYTIVHSCDFDTVIPAISSRLLGKKVVYDIFDCFADSRNLPIILKTPLLFLEAFAAKFANLTIFPDTARIQQLPLTIKRNLTIENVPSIQFESHFKKKISHEKSLRLSYVGTLTTERGIEDLLDVVSNNDHIVLEIAGVGALSQLVKEYSLKYKNINFHGLVSQPEGLQIMASADLNYAMYYLGGKFDTNHRLACPNKFYESLLTQTPLVTNRGTLFSQKIETLGVGFTISQGKSALEEFLKNPAQIYSKIEFFQRNATHQWTTKYQSYYQKVGSELALALKIDPH